MKIGKTKQAGLIFLTNLNRSRSKFPEIAEPEVTEDDSGISGNAEN